MNNTLKYSVQIVLNVVLIVGVHSTLHAEKVGNTPIIDPKKDTVPSPPRSIFRKIGDYMDSLRNRHYRDSVLEKISRHNDSIFTDENGMQKSELIFSPHTGKVIRNIYFQK